MGKRPSLNPSRQSAFGKCVGLIFYECGLSYQAAAPLLNTSNRLISDIVAGRKIATRELLAKRCWRAQLAEYNPEVWSRYEREFDDLASKLPLKNVRANVDPVPKTSFGQALLNVLGGLGYDRKLARNVLGSDIFEILKGRAQPSQTSLAARDWAGKLQRNFPEGWSRHGESFLHAVGKLKVRRRIKSREPADRGSFGYVIWKLIGGPYIDRSVAKDVLGISPFELKDLLYNKKQLKALAVDVDRWRKTLEAKFPERWSEYREEFERHAVKLCGGETK